MDKCEQTYGPGDLSNDPALDGSNHQQGCAPSNDPVRNPPCKKAWQLTNSSDSSIIDAYIEESINIAASNANVFKLLGIHEQYKITDAAGHGKPISGGNLGNFPANQAFSLFDSSWKSLQRGSDDIIASAFIGYDFGIIKTNQGDRQRYSVENAGIFKDITTIKIMQSSKPQERAGKVRLERSNCGMRWKGVQIIELPDDDCLNTFLLRSSVSSRYWRLRPTEFNGGARDSWGVKAFQLIDKHLATHESNIQDKIFLENRDREYSMAPIEMKIYFDLQETQSTLDQLGLQVSNETLFASASFSSAVANLGRPFIVGDILQIEAMTQYSADLQPIEKYMEIIDTMWASEGYTPQWKPTLQRLILQPAMATRETQNIFGDLGNRRAIDSMGLIGGDDGNHPLYQDYTDVTEEIEAEGRTITPENGADKSGVHKFDEDELDKIIARVEGADENVVRQRVKSLGQDGLNHFQASDGMPPNSAPYTESDAFPKSPKNKDYHRLTYTNVDEDLPVKLFRFSSAKNRWIFIESDYRQGYDSIRPVLQEFINSDHGVSITKVSKK